MDLRFLTEYCVPVILAACLVIGYCIKHISWLDKVGNQYIPVIIDFYSGDARSGQNDHSGDAGERSCNGFGKHRIAPNI